MNRFTIHVNQADSHVHFRLFVNGTSAGILCMRFDEYFAFKRCLQPDGDAVIQFRDSLAEKLVKEPR